jgi:hypothetical protein
MLSDAELTALTPDERHAYSEYVRRNASRSQRDLDVIATLVRVLKKQKGRQIPLAHELRELLRPSNDRR